jgi:hypothetical protein
MPRRSRADEIEMGVVERAADAVKVREEEVAVDEPIE